MENNKFEAERFKFTIPKDDFATDEQKAQIWTEYLHESLNRFPKDKVIEILKDQNQIYRIVKEDDNSYMITQDLMPNRINLEFENGYLTNSYLG